MKSIFAFLLVLLPVALWAQALRLVPEKPRAGQRLTILYDPAKTKLAQAPSVNFVVYWLRPEGEPIAQEIIPTRTGRTFQATVTVPDTVAAMAFVFEYGERREANGGKGYLQLLAGQGTQPVPGAWASIGQLHLKYHEVVGLQDRDREQARSCFEQEFREHPTSKRKHLPKYLSVFNPRREEDRVPMLAHANEFSRFPDLTQEEMDALIHAYDQVGKPELADAVKERRRQQARVTEPYLKAFKLFASSTPMTLAQRGKAFQKVMDEYQANPRLNYRRLQEEAYGRYLQTLADSGKTTEFDALAKKVPAAYQPVTMSTYNRIALDLIKGGTNLERAAELSREAAVWAKNRIAQPRESDDSPSLTATQVRKNRERTYAAYASTYGQALARQGRNLEALPHLEDAAKRYYGYQSPETNEWYLTVLEAVNPDSVQAEAEAMMKAGKGTPAIEHLLHVAYIQGPNRTVEYESYLMGLRKQADQRRRTELREKMISRPAPDFNLSDLQGKPVRLADLKGKVVVVDFWATWCGPCIASFPGMQQAIARFEGDPNVVFLFVNSWQQESDKKKTAADFIAKKGYAFTVPLDEKDEVIANFDVTGIPTKFVIDKSGTIRFKSMGYHGHASGLADELATMIELARESAN